MNHYTFDDAKKEVGNRTDWAIAREVTVKKWEEIAKSENEYYWRLRECGFCFVARNREPSCNLGREGSCRKICPAAEICYGVGEKGTAMSPEDVVSKLKALRLP